ncbi:hypothetical protein, partial [Streptomyces sp. NPDC002082]|uniref:hypothetical protein n=1 Tax=Streptomyces sp. NPDC002082 TaxID=3154772 RepID=UPI00332977CA
MDAAAFNLGTYGIPLLVLATTSSAMLTGLAFAGSGQRPGNGGRAGRGQPRRAARLRPRGLPGSLGLRGCAPGGFGATPR